MPQPLTEQNSSSENATPLTLHAEYLPNIRQVSVQVSVSGPATKTHPEISLSESRRAVTASLTLPGTEHEYISETIKLPARVTEASRRALSGDQSRAARSSNGHGEATGNEVGGGEGCIPNSREYSYRMQVDECEVAQTRQGAGEEDPMDSFVPWSAGQMASSTKLRCRACESMILDEPRGLNLDPEDNASRQLPEGEASWVWKDLPSGNWAEMMDFWHCHKPDQEPGESRDAVDENSVVKGYGASNQVLAVAGTVLVDVATFLVSDGDCLGLEKVSKGRSLFSLFCLFPPFAGRIALWAKRRRPCPFYDQAFDTIALDKRRLALARGSFRKDQVICSILI